jgi:hypothetical protein
MHWVLSSFNWAGSATPLTNACCAMTHVSAPLPSNKINAEFTVWFDLAAMQSGAEPIGKFSQILSIPEGQSDGLLIPIQGIAASAFASGEIAPLLDAELVQ